MRIYDVRSKYHVIVPHSTLLLKFLETYVLSMLLVENCLDSGHSFSRAIACYYVQKCTFLSTFFQDTSWSSSLLNQNDEPCPWHGVANGHTFESGCFVPSVLPTAP